MKAVFLVSGGGGHLRFVWHASRILKLDLEIVAVYADRYCHAVDFAKDNGINTLVSPYTRRQPEVLNAFLHQSNADLIVTNIHKILAPSTLASCVARWINLHYSLLPAYSGFIGMAAVDAAKADRASRIGATSHLVTEQVDAGPILMQASFLPRWDSVYTAITDTVFRAASLILLHSLVSDIHKSAHQERFLTHGYEIDFSQPLCFDHRLLEQAHIWDLVNQQ